MLTPIDEYTHECLAIGVVWKLNSTDLLDCLGRYFACRTVPEHIRSDNNAGFTAIAVREWLSAAKVKTLFIEPGSPWENGYNESLNDNLRDELLNGASLYTLHEAKIMIESWWIYYNTIRPPAPQLIQTKPVRIPFVIPMMETVQWESYPNT